MDLSPEKLFMVGLIALLVVGPQRLPQAARTAGRALAEARRLSAGLQAEVAEALIMPRKVVTDLTDELNGGQGAVSPSTSSASGGARPDPGPQALSLAEGPVPDDPVLN